MTMQPTGGWLTLVCVQTGKEIDTGVVYTEADLERAQAAKLLMQCRHCGRSHIFKFSEARLKPSRH